MILIATCGVGCSPVGGDSPSFIALSENLDGNNDASPSHRVDAGIVFADQESYLCFPLDRFNIASAKLVQNIESSCDCVVPSLVRYIGASGQMTDGLRIDFAGQSTGSSITSAALLGVELRLSLVDADDCLIEEQFLQTVARVDDIAGAQPSS